MNREIIKVPKGIRYISDWKEYSLNDYQFPHILNKQITGCGYTEYCLRNDMDIILCSPRRILLDNKEDQHTGEVLYVRNELESTINYDKDTTSQKPNPSHNEVKATDEDKKSVLAKMKKSIIDWYDSRKLDIFDQKPCKILVTYDSFRIVKETLQQRGVFNHFYVVVDEMQSLLGDSTFKSSTEIEFLNHLKDVQKVCYLSATPMLDDFLEMLDEFKDLPYYKLDWASEDPGRISKPQLSIKFISDNLTREINRIIKSYLDGDFETYIYKTDEGKVKEIKSDQAVIYVNSVKNICEVISRNKLLYENTNVLCARTPENEKKVRKAFGLKSGQEGGIGRVPKKDEPHKMFTLCTRTVYLGADFNSTCARSFIFANANNDCLSVDISMDLPQILGRQRLEDNPWKNRAELYLKTRNKQEEIEKFKARIEKKQEKTLSLLESYKYAPDNNKHDLAEEFLTMADCFNYKNHYVAVNKHAGGDLVPVFNNLVYVSDLRVYKMQQIDFKDRFTVLSTISKTNDIFIDEFDNKLKEFDKCSTFIDKMKFICNTGYDDITQSKFLKQIPAQFEGYYNVLGPEKLKTLKYRKDMIKAEYDKIVNNQDINLKNKIYSLFEIGKRYLKSDIKETLSNLYISVGYNKTPKANDLEQYFEIKPCQIVNKETGKKDHAFEILSKK